MKQLLIAVMLVCFAAPTLASNSLRDRIEQVNDEDQRLVDGNYNQSSGKLTLYTQDMVAGKDGDIARRAVDVKGFEVIGQGINKNKTDINNIDGRVTTNTTDISDQGDRITVNEGDISILNQHQSTMSNQITNNRSAINIMNNAISDIRGGMNDLSAGIAGGFAAASHQFDPRGNFQLSLAVGSYRDQSAGSIAIGGSVSEKVFINANLTTDSRGHQGLGAGINFGF